MVMRLGIRRDSKHENKLDEGAPVASHFADRVWNAVKEKRAPACVGFDPLIERLPRSLLGDAGIQLSDDGKIVGEIDPKTAAGVMSAFGREVIRAVAPFVGILKINIAFFERYHADGIQAYDELVRFAADSGLIVIGDVKRADIGHSTTQYAYAQLHGSVAHTAPDAVTVNPYFGFDAIAPFVDIAQSQNRGLFVLVQTSNESASEVQGLELSTGETLCQRVGSLVEGWATDHGSIGTQGYSSIGAVVSPRDIESTKRIRTLMPHCLFLVPGFGAQGRTAEEVAHCFKADGTGAIVTASRSVIYAYQQPEADGITRKKWTHWVEQGCREFVDAVRAVVPC